MNFEEHAAKPLLADAGVAIPPSTVARTAEEAADIASSLVKAAVFGFIVALMGCYHGMNSGRGAQGVGRATTNAVVSSSVMILAANYLLTELFF